MSFFKQKKIGILVISRYKSKRLKNKAALKINDKNITEILIKRLIQKIDNKQIVICSSKTNNNLKFYKSISKNYKINFFFDSELNVLKRIIKCAQKFRFKHIVRVTGDNPLTDIDAILPMCVKHLKNKCDYTYNDSLPRGTRVEIFSLKSLKKNYSKIIDLNSTEYLSYFFRRKDLYKIQKKNFKKYFKNQNLLSVSIDTKKDFNILKKFLIKNQSYEINKKKLYNYLRKKKKFKDEIKIIPFKTKNFDIRYNFDDISKKNDLILS